MREWPVWLIVLSASLFVCVLMFIIIIPFVYFLDKTRNNDFEKLCASKGWSNNYYLEPNGKTSTTIRFCFDKDGTMKWPYEIKE